VRGKLIALLGKIAEDNASLRPRIAAGLIDLANVGETAAIAQLGKCGRDAKDALPILKKFKLHPTETVRNAANQAIAQIEEALASAAQPSRTDVPQPKREPKQRREEANLPRELQPHVAQLKSGNTEERIKACMALEDLGEKAQPATRALCDAALSTSQKLSRAALKALEKVNPEIQKPVFILLVDEKAINHKDALRKLSAL
jgi:hypothetical protein